MGIIKHGKHLDLLKQLTGIFTGIQSDLCKTGSAIFRSTDVILDVASVIA